VEFRDVLANRHSVREFNETPVPRTTVERVISAAGHAPSAMNSQPWRFHIATGEARVRVGQTIAQATVHLSEYIDVMGADLYEQAVRWYSELGGAPVVIGVSMAISDDDSTQADILLSIGAAIENLLLATVDEGLAACNVTYTQWVRDELQRDFGIAEDRVLVSVIVLGHAAQSEVASPTRNADIADWLE